MTNQKPHASFFGKYRKLIIPIIVCLIFTISVFFAIQSTFLINNFASIFKDSIGFDIRVSDISLSPTLDGEIRGLYVAQLGEENTFFSVSHIQFEGRVNQSLQGEIKRAVFKEPNLSMLLGKKGEIELSFLNKLPAVELLDITKGEALFLVGSSGVSIKLTDITLNIRDFSPKKGGRFSLKSHIKVESKDNEYIAEKGYLEADFIFSHIQPTPIGKGNVKLNFGKFHIKNFDFQDTSANLSIEIKKDEIAVNSITGITGKAVYRSEGKYLVFNNLHLKPFGNYNIKKSELNVGMRQSAIENLGSFDININSIITKNIIWNASIKAESINFERTSEILKQFMTSQYKNWSFQGYGDSAANLKGEYRNGEITGGGKMQMLFKDGGFSSPEGDKAIQGASGKIILDIQIPTSNKKGQLDLTSETSLGEFLWGKYYKDFGKKKFLLLTHAKLNDKWLKSAEFSGSIDIAEAGEYQFTALVDRPKWSINLKSGDINLEDFSLLLIRDYLAQDNPSLANLQLKGLSTFEINLDGIGEGFSLKGNLTSKDVHLNKPNTFLINAELTLPFDLFYPTLDYSSVSEDDIKTGILHIKKLKSSSFDIGDLNIPIILSKNSFWIPQKIDIPISDSTITLLNFKGENLLFEEPIFSIGLLIKNLELASLIENATDVNVPAKLNAELKDAIYKNNELKINGSAIIDIFGGRVNLYNMHGRKLFSQSRMLGSDIAFENIDLQDLTQYIELGRMSGIIKGSLKNFEIEYGQPSRFILDIDSVKTPGVAQNVSVDAIENISIIGSGSKGIGTTLKRGLSQFFKHYSYSRIGILCILENDIFTIRGKIFEGGKEYLIRKTFFGGIDLINQNPQNNISFKDMKERLSRVLDKKQ